MNQIPSRKDAPEDIRKKRILFLVSAGIMILLLVGLSFLIGGPLVETIRNQASFRLFMQERGFLKYPLMIGLMALQVIFAFIPGEPIEIAAGYTFGPWGGLLLCLTGAALGSVLIVLFVRKYGMRLVTLFFTREQLENIRFFKDPRKWDVTVFLLFLLPGTPKDVLTYLAGLTPIHLGRFLLLTTVARIPSVLSSTMVGSYVDAREYRLAVIVFGATVVLGLGAALSYRVYQHRKALHETAESESPEHIETAKENNDVPIG